MDAGLVVAIVGGGLGLLSLIGMAADWLQARSVEDAPHDYTDGFCPVHIRSDNSGE
jgi:hypothetical protein